MSPIIKLHNCLKFIQKTRCQPAKYDSPPVNVPHLCRPIILNGTSCRNQLQLLPFESGFKKKLSYYCLLCLCDCAPAGAHKKSLLRIAFILLNRLSYTSTNLQISSAIPIPISVSLFSTISGISAGYLGSI